jgi:hypothetical protein
VYLLFSRKIGFATARAFCGVGHVALHEFVFYSYVQSSALDRLRRQASKVFLSLMKMCISGSGGFDAERGDACQVFAIINGLYGRSFLVLATTNAMRKTVSRISWPVKGLDRTAFIQGIHGPKFGHHPSYNVQSTHIRVISFALIFASVGMRTWSTAQGFRW